MIASTIPRNEQKLLDDNPKITFEQFLEICSIDGCCEFVDGQIADTSGNFSSTKHDDAVEIVSHILANKTKLLSYGYDVRKSFCVSHELNLFADCCIFDEITQSSLIQFVVEIVSSNWEDDYIDNFLEYQRLKISEYWIIDYMAIASREFLGNPKIPTVFVNLLDENGKYQTTKFTGDEKIISRTFPELDLTAAQILNI